MKLTNHLRSTPSRLFLYLSVQINGAVALAIERPVPAASTKLRTTRPIHGFRNLNPGYMASSSLQSHKPNLETVTMWKCTSDDFCKYVVWALQDSEGSKSHILRISQNFTWGSLNLWNREMGSGWNGRSVQSSNLQVKHSSASRHPSEDQGISRPSLSDLCDDFKVLGQSDLWSWVQLCAGQMIGSLFCVKLSLSQFTKLARPKLKKRFWCKNDSNVTSWPGPSRLSDELISVTSCSFAARAWPEKSTSSVPKTNWHGIWIKESEYSTGFQGCGCEIYSCLHLDKSTKKRFRLQSSGQICPEGRSHRKNTNQIHRSHLSIETWCRAMSPFTPSLGVCSCIQCSCWARLAELSTPHLPSMHPWPHGLGSHIAGMPQMPWKCFSANKIIMPYYTNVREDIFRPLLGAARKSLFFVLCHTNNIMSAWSTCVSMISMCHDCLKPRGLCRKWWLRLAILSNFPQKPAALPHKWNTLKWFETMKRKNWKQMPMQL